MNESNRGKKEGIERWYGNPDTVLDIDEMNSIEFPLALLARNSSTNNKELSFKDRIKDSSSGQWLDRTCTVSANVDSELPNWWDQDVFLALKVLTNRKNRWQNPVVNFTLYELLKIMKLPSDGANIKRLAKSIDNWQGVRVKYSHWRVRKRWTHPKAFGFIQDYDLTRHGKKLPEEPQVFTWSRLFFESVGNSGGKPFDSEFYFDLKLPTTKRLYRFLDKRLRTRPFYDYQLIRFCTEKIGMSRGYKKPYKYKEKITPAYEELIEKGFLADLPKTKRFTENRINFARGKRKSKDIVPVKVELTKENSNLYPVAKKLVSLGVSEQMAKNLARDFSKEEIENQIEHLLWIEKNGRGVRCSGAWLVKAIMESYKTPEGFVSRKEQEARKKKDLSKASEKSIREEKLLKDQELESKNQKIRIQRTFQKLNPGQRKKLIDEAIEAASKTHRSLYQEHKEKGNKVMMRRYLGMILEQHLL